MSAECIRKVISQPLRGDFSLRGQGRSLVLGLALPPAPEPGLRFLFPSPLHLSLPSAPFLCASYSLLPSPLDRSPQGRGGAKVTATSTVSVPLASDWCWAEPIPWHLLAFLPPWLPLYSPVSCQEQRALFPALHLQGLAGRSQPSAEALRDAVLSGRPMCSSASLYYRTPEGGTV